MEEARTIGGVSQVYDGRPLAKNGRVCIKRVRLDQNENLTSRNIINSCKLYYLLF